MQENNPVVPQTPAPQVPAPAAINKNSANLITLLVLLLLLSLGGTGYLAYQNMQLQKQIAGTKTISYASPSPLPTSSPSATPDPTVNWKTYTNAQLGFSFKYPNNLNLTEDSKRPGFVVVSTLNSISEGSEDFHMEIFDNPKNLSASDYVKSIYSTDLLKETTQKAILVSGVESIELFNAPGTPQYHIEVYIPYKGKVFSPGLDTANSTSDFVNIFNQILSTFKFTQ